MNICVHLTWVTGAADLGKYFSFLIYEIFFQKSLINPFLFKKKKRFALNVAINI